MKLRKWASDMAEQKSGKMTRRDWCQRQGMSLSTYDRRCREVRKFLAERVEENRAIVPAAEKEITPEPIFAKVNLTSTGNRPATIHIRFANGEIDIASDANTEHIKVLMEVLASAE